MKFEYLRLKRSNFIFYGIFIFIITFLLSLLNDSVVQISFNSNNLILRNYYDGFSQTIPFFLYPLLAYYFSQDFENGVDYFYLNNCISQRKWLFTKAFMVFVILSIINIMYQIILLIVFSANIFTIFVTLSVTELFMIYIILVSIIISIFVKKKMSSVFAGLAFQFIISIINFITKKICYGTLYIMDMHSFVTKTMVLLFNGNSNSVIAMFINILTWILVLFIISFIFIKKDELNGYNN